MPRPSSKYKSTVGTQGHGRGGSGAATPAGRVQGAADGWQNEYFKWKWFVFSVQNLNY